MIYNKTAFIKASLLKITLPLAFSGLCFLCGWSSLFLFFGLATAALTARLPLFMIIRGLFSKEKAVVLENILDLILMCVLAQKLLVASCVKLCVVMTIAAVVQAIATLGISISPSARATEMEGKYGVYAPLARDLGPVNDLPHPSQVASSTVRTETPYSTSVASSLASDEVLSTRRTGALRS